MIQPAPPTIVICERNRFLADSLCHAFAETGAFAGVAHGGCDDGLLDLVSEVEAAAVVLDPATLPGQPATLAQALATAHPDCRAVAYFAPEATPQAAGCLRDGFGGAVSQNKPIDHLVEALHTVCVGGIYVDRALIPSDLVRRRRRPSGVVPGTLSRRERFVLENVARGLSHKEIARKLDLSTKTVETYKYRAARKLGLSRKSSIVDYALRNDWLS